MYGNPWNQKCNGDGDSDSTSDYNNDINNDININNRRLATASCSDSTPGCSTKAFKRTQCEDTGCGTKNEVGFVCCNADCCSGASPTPAPAPPAPAPSNPQRQQRWCAVPVTTPSGKKDFTKNNLEVCDKDDMHTKETYGFCSVRYFYSDKDPFCFGYQPPDQYAVLNGLELLSGELYNKTGGPGGLCILTCTYDSDCYSIGARCVPMNWGSSGGGVCLFSNRQGNGIINSDTPESHPYPVMNYLEKNLATQCTQVHGSCCDCVNAYIGREGKICKWNGSCNSFDGSSKCPGGCAPAGCTLPGTFGPHIIPAVQSGCQAGGAIKSGVDCNVQCDTGYGASGTTSYQCTNGQLTDATLTCSAPAPSPDDNCFPKNGIGVNINTLDLYPAGNVSVLCTSSSDPTKYSIALRCNDFDHDFSINGVDYKNMHSRCSLKNGMRQLPKAFPTNKLCQNICYENFCTEADSTYNDATSSWVLPTNCIAPPSKFFNKFSKYN